LLLNIIAEGKRQEDSFWSIFIAIVFYGIIGIYIFLSLPSVKG
jgi:hypothetical protein